MDSQRLINYLLGGLQGEERRQIEERYFDDDAFFQEMLILEEELIDSYVNGELSGEQVERFEKHYLTTPERRSQVEFAKSLAASLSSVKINRALKEPHSQVSSDPSTLITASSRQRHPLTWGFIAGLVVVVGGALLLLIGNLRLYTHANRLEQERAALSHQREETDRLNDQMNHSLKRLEQETNRIESISVTSANASITIRPLFPMLTRSEQAGTVLHISPQTTLLILQAPVESLAIKSYQVVVTKDGAEVLRLNQLKSRSTKGGNIVEIPLTASMFDGRSYSLMVKSEDGQEGTDIYSFEIQIP
ncbi:MAG: hypothetical protein V7641_292 [Blastocatellia bacterium]